MSVVLLFLLAVVRPPVYIVRLFRNHRGGLPLKVFDNVIRNLLDSWLDSKIPDFIPEISCSPSKESICHKISNIRKVATNYNKKLKFTGII